MAEVLGLLAARPSGREAAAELGLSVRTAERHVATISTKLDVENRRAARTLAQRHGGLGLDRAT